MTEKKRIAELERRLKIVAHAGKDMYATLLTQYEALEKDRDAWKLLAMKADESALLQKISEKFSNDFVTTLTLENGGSLTYYPPGYDHENQS